MLKFQKMTFGLCNAGATFQRLMDIVLSGLYIQECSIYLADIIFSKTTEQHLERIIIVLDRVYAAGFNLKPAKMCWTVEAAIRWLQWQRIDMSLGL